MKTNKLETSESESKRFQVPEHDIELISYLTEKYGTDSVVENINEYDSYYGYDHGNFSQTGGSRVRGVGGLIKSIPSFAITAAVSWPAAVLAAIGALSYRFQKKYEEKDSFLNKFNPAYWTEYIATPRRDKKENQATDGDTFGSKVKKALGIGAAAAAGAYAGNKLANKNNDENAISPEEMKNNDFKEYWVTLSNYEILRLRADNEENVKKLANTIITQTKPTYELLNRKLKENPDMCVKYTFTFSDGEVCYWAGADGKRQAYDEALKSRQDLCNALNKTFSGLIVLDTLDVPVLVGNPVKKKGELIELPKPNNFIKISTTKPDVRISKEDKTLKQPVYKFDRFEQCKITWRNFSFNIPFTKQADAEDFIHMFANNDTLLEKIYKNAEREETIYGVTMPDGDQYVIPSISTYDAAGIAMQIYNTKVRILKSIYKDVYKRDYENFLEDYGAILGCTKSIRALKDYNKDNFKKGHALSVRVNEKGEPKDKSIKIEM